MSSETLKVSKTFRVYDIIRVEPRDASALSPRVRARVFYFSPSAAKAAPPQNPKDLGEAGWGSEAAMQETVTARRPGGW
jgi:hypothetical protein